MYEVLFYLAVGAFLIYRGYRKMRSEEIVLHDPHADDFNKDIWED